MKRILLFFSGVMLYAACQQSNGSGVARSQEMHERTDGQGSVDTATFAGGCFWCTEVQFQQLEGVDTVLSGYTGGTIKNPSYKQVTTGKTGHAEAIHVIYRPDVISYDELLKAFFVAHDPTQLNRQGNDIGPQYRSAIFYHDDTEKEKAAYYIQRLNEEKVYDRPIVTTLEPYTAFYIAEDYHQNYFNLNPEQAYCQYIIVPKLDKFKKVFKERLKK
ncbi:peptide-methionine (S)-S-oxide reductase MsrA [Parapedobacter indicus]|uniref:Peptide methionine sulfoxide reductase MsrA n=1 Tax=Parapedobacter indicus TaxID=1477437 RepID=A0A1I3NGG7_9SPHI|nr:peptide-methionine (S)-S-oxide reductase MsrA [Parapedobacter indicus]PPL00977.1 peptide-methionine (S)-S-oxide reductase [Parapedobacter indicus]SFJ08269.1 peptide-methionine (S)-S-oxide reductase [Parapedobacter indicus]